MPRLWNARLVTALGLSAWGVVVALGLFAVHAYEFTPGCPPTAGELWPESSSILRDRGRASLVLAAHPRCPCTQASLDELARVMERNQGAVAAHVLFYRPRSSRAPWGPQDLLRRARSIPGVMVHDDPDGIEAARFGAETSGTVLLYNPSGRLVFEGGITPTRGRAGDNPGADAVKAHLAGREAANRLSCSPVFGCPLRGAHSIARVP